MRSVFPIKFRSKALVGYLEVPSFLNEPAGGACIVFIVVPSFRGSCCPLELIPESVVGFF